MLVAVLVAVCGKCFIHYGISTYDGNSQNAQVFQWLAMMRRDAS
jgi:hypothetical protein